MPESAFWGAGKALFLALAAGKVGGISLLKFTELRLKCFSESMF